VDDASSDRTTEVALEYTKDHDIIRVLRLGENHGKGGAVKLGVQKARGKYILMVRI
jgi:dolichyl-phosphate beta-glucosyltransferase